jgi:hypothetical protein
MPLIRKLIKQLRILSCAYGNIGVSRCVSDSSNFNLLIKDTSTSVQQTGLECKRCKRYILFEG